MAAEYQVYKPTQEFVSCVAREKKRIEEGKENVFKRIRECLKRPGGEKCPEEKKKLDGKVKR